MKNESASQKGIQASQSAEPIITLVGPIAAGKGTVADILLTQGYTPFNYGDVIYTERTKRGLKEERKNSNAVGAILRSEFGNDIIARKIGQSICEMREQKILQKILIDGLRHPAEVAWVKENLGSQVIGITAPQEVRFERVLKRNRIVDPKSLDDFKIVDEEDRGIGANEHANQSDECLALADVVINNDNEDVQEYIRKFHEALKKLGVETI
jgi:dephospho-CoA kinase